MKIYKLQICRNVVTNVKEQIKNNPDVKTNDLIKTNETTKTQTVIESMDILN